MLEKTLPLLQQDIRHLIEIRRRIFVGHATTALLAMVGNDRYNHRKCPLNFTHNLGCGYGFLKATLTPSIPQTIL